MTDLEITRLCAEAIGFDQHFQDRTSWKTVGRWLEKDWNPLNDDAQAMMLVKQIGMLIVPPPDRAKIDWGAAAYIGKEEYASNGMDLNRAICECVAKMQAAK